MGNRKCPVCGESHGTAIKKIQMDIPKEYHLPDSYYVAVCENCGLVYADTSASMEDYDWYYTHCNFYGDDSKDDNSIRFDMTKELLEKHLSKSSLILEIGAGNGRFTKALKKHGYLHAIGTDPSEESVKRLQKEGIQAYVSSIYDPVLPEETEKYDGIFLFEVAEHLLMPGKGIGNIAKMLKKNSIFMVSVPDYSRIGEDTSSIPNYFNLEHINYFSEISLDHLMALHGMKRVDQTRFGVDLVHVYQKTGDVKMPDKDTITEIAVRTYFGRLKERESQISQVIEELLMEKKELIVWGTGSYVMSLFSTTNLAHCRIQGFVDNNKLKQGRHMYGYPIYPPEYLEGKACTILICSMLYGKQIKAQIENMHGKHEIIVL